MEVIREILSYKPHLIAWTFTGRDNLGSKVRVSMQRLRDLTGN